MGLLLKNNKIKFPRRYPKVERVLATAKTKSHVVVDGFTLRRHVDFIPQPGLQEDVCASDCNLIFMCGQGTSGKTFALYFKALGGIDKYGFTSRIISFQSKDNKKGTSMLRDGITVLGNFAGCEVVASETPTFAYPKYNSNLQLIHCNFNADNPSEYEEFQEYAKKQQASLIMIDEATAIKQFKIFLFWFMRNRDESGMPPQIILTFNPRHHHWTTAMLRDAGYLDEKGHYLRKDMIGVVRYFYNKGDTPEGIIWGSSKQEVVERAGLVLKPEDAAAGLTVYDYVKSFTVFTGTAADNRELVNATQGQSVANLHATGETQRAVVGEAYFGPDNDETVSVNREMIRQLWDNPEDSDTQMYATMDVSSGKEKNDKMPMIIWRGLRMVAIELFSGQPADLKSWIDSRLRKYNVPVSNFAFDATGHGYWVQAFTDGIPVTWNRRVMQEYDSSGNAVTTDEYFNLRSQLLGKTEVLIKTGLLSCAIPQDTVLTYGRSDNQRQLVEILYDETNLFIAQRRNNKTYYRSTEEFKDRFKFSPDIMTTIALRAIFTLDARERKKPPQRVQPDTYVQLYKNSHRPAPGRTFTRNTNSRHGNKTYLSFNQQ